MKKKPDLRTIKKKLKEGQKLTQAETRKWRAKNKELAWQAFSKYIRTRDCIRFNGSLETGTCVTCNKSFPLKSLQAGHFVSGRNDAVLFNEEVVHTQCIVCNVMKGGMYAEYAVFMLKQGYTQEQIEDFIKLKQSPLKYDVDYFISIKNDYNSRTSTIIEQFNQKDPLEIDQNKLNAVFDV